MVWSLTDPARDDLDHIWWHIADDNVPAADKVIARLVERFDMLSRQPLIGEACPELTPELRNFPVRPYVIYYTVKADQADEVVILRILHGAQDSSRHF